MAESGLIDCRNFSSTAGDISIYLGFSVRDLFSTWILYYSIVGATVALQSIVKNDVAVKITVSESQAADIFSI